MIASLFFVAMLCMVESSKLCPTEGGCNRPKASKSYVKLIAEQPLSVETAPEVYASTNFPTELKEATQKGVDFVRTLIGSASHTSLFFYEEGGSDSSYDIVNEAWCEKTRSAGWCNDGSQNTQTAKSTDDWGEFFMSGGSTCNSCNNETTHNSSPLAFIPGKTVSSWEIELRAVHEYVHAWQSAFTDQTPNWLIEGGAVFMECVYEANQGRSFSDCFKFSGGRGGIVRNVRTIYSSSESKWLTNYGEDRCCGSDCPGTRGDTQNTWGYYDVGALAIAFAIYKADAATQDDDSRTLLDFWTSTDGQRGFWHSIYPWDGFDPMTSWPSDVPEGFGWKAALTNFTGHPSVAVFYEEFENWVAPGGVVRSEDELLSILETDADVFDMSRIPARFSCFTVRDGACGGSSSPPCPVEPQTPPPTESLIAPPSPCKDSPARTTKFNVGNERNKTCAAVRRDLSGKSMARKRRICRTRVKVKGSAAPKKFIEKICPVTCEICPDQCKNQNKRFHINDKVLGLNVTKKKCSFIEKRKESEKKRLCRGKVELLNGKMKLLKKLCLESCGRARVGRCARSFP